MLYRAANASGAAAAGAGSDAAGGHGNSGSAGPQKPAEGEVIDAEYVDVDDPKKPN